MNSELSVGSASGRHAETISRDLGDLEVWAGVLPLQIWTARPDGSLDFVSDRVADYFGVSADEILDAGWLRFVHPDDADAAVQSWTSALQAGARYEVLFRLRGADGGYRWHVAQAVPYQDADGSILRWFGANTDVDAQVRAREALRRSEARAAFVAAASRQLASSLDYEETLRNVARLAVPDFADWCAVDLLSPAGDLVRVAVEHPDPARVEMVRDLARRYPDPPDDQHGVLHVVRTGRPEWAESIPAELIERAAVDDEHLAMLRSLDLRSYVVAPLAARGEVLGAMTFAYAESGRAYAEPDVAFVEDLARRAATAIENARLVRRLRETQAILEQQTHELQLQAAQVDEQAMELEMANDDLQATLDRVARSENLLAEAQAAAHLGSWEWDVASNAVTWSDELFRLFGLEPGSIDVSFDSYLARIHPDDLDRTRDAIQLAFAGGEPFVIDHRIVRADGEVRDLHCRGRAIPGPDGRTARMTGSAQDVTEDKAAEATLERARLEAEHANRAKSEFLASMSHELRTPLNAIAGHLELVEMGIYGEVTDAQKAAFTRIRANQEHLLRLINDILQFAKLEAGRLEIRDESLPLERVLRETVYMLEPQARARGLRFHLDSPADPTPARGDEERVRQIVVNLVGNAIKFTEPGGEVAVTAHTAGDWIDVQVRDTGPGIAPDMQEAIFDPFVQAGRQTTSSHQGVGLGLAISRDLARTMGGDVTVQSRPGAGSTFTLRLRADRSPGA